VLKIAKRVNFSGNILTFRKRVRCVRLQEKSVAENAFAADACLSEVNSLKRKNRKPKEERKTRP